MKTHNSLLPTDACCPAIVPKQWLRVFDSPEISGCFGFQTERIWKVFYFFFWFLFVNVFVLVLFRLCVAVFCGLCLECFANSVMSIHCEVV